MGYSAGDISISFESNLTKIRRDLRSLRADAERPIRLRFVRDDGGSGGGGGGYRVALGGVRGGAAVAGVTPPRDGSVNGGRGISARVTREGRGRVRFGGTRRNMDELVGELSPEYLPEVNRYGDNRRKTRERQSAAIDKVAAVFNKQADDDEKRQRKESERRDRERAKVSARVDKAFDQSALAQQKEEERGKARARQQADRSALRRRRIDQDTELAEARTPEFKREILQGWLSQAAPGSEESARIRNRIAKVDTSGPSAR